MLKGKVAIVTGASRGIGRNIALRYAKEGAKVVLGSRTMELLEKVAEEIKKGGGETFPIALDVRHVESIKNMVSETIKRYGQVDILVNNAAIPFTRPSEELNIDDWKNAIDTDLNSVFYCSQMAGREMIRQKQGNIINITSCYGIVAAPMRAAYCTSKAGVNMLTKVLAVEWAKYNIRVNAIAPGYVSTQLVLDTIARGVVNQKDLLRRIPVGRMANVDEIEGTAVFLASDEASYITGSVISVDGGWTAYGHL